MNYFKVGKFQNALETASSEGFVEIFVNSKRECIAINSNGYAKKLVCGKFSGTIFKKFPKINKKQKSKKYCIKNILRHLESKNKNCNVTFHDAIIITKTWKL